MGGRGCWEFSVNIEMEGLILMERLLYLGTNLLARGGGLEGQLSVTLRFRRIESIAFDAVD